MNTALDIYFKQIQDIPVLTKKQERELIQKAQAGDKLAWDSMVEHNLKLVVSIASIYTTKHLSILDLISVGNIGIMDAISDFDLKKKNKFSTYAFWKIRQKISREIVDKEYLIRVPLMRYEQRIKYLRFERMFDFYNNRLPTDKEIIKKLGFSEGSLNSIRKSIMFFWSFDLVKDDRDSKLSREIYEAMKVTKEEYREPVDFSHADFAVLTKRELDFVKMRYGFEPYNSDHTLEEIGKKHKITRERVRQILANIIRKLRKGKHIKELHEK